MTQLTEKVEGGATQWWLRDEKAEHAAETALPAAVAYYRHSSQCGQENSVEIQQDNVRAFAEQHQVRIVREFADRGKSGLNAEGRPAFTELMQLVKENDDFKYVLVLDVSRWGRFQDTDLSAHYESLCNQHDKKVIYSDIGFPKEEDALIDNLRKNIDRYQAADYVKKLSAKVYNGCVKIANQGYRPGGPQPYGFYRFQLDEKKEPFGVLHPGQKKAYQNGRVILVPGDENQVKTVREIFRLFVEDGWDEQQIAGRLNSREIPSPGGGNWGVGSVRRILVNQQYAGALVYNKTTQKMKTKPRRNPREDWIVMPDAYEAIVSPEVFELARRRFNERKRRFSPEEMVAKLRELEAKYNMVSSKIIASDDKGPRPGSVSREFGGMRGAYQALHSEVVERARNDIFAALADSVRIISEHNDFVIINNDFTVIIQPRIAMPRGYGVAWYFKPDLRPVVDITLGVPLSDEGNHEILGYLALPRLTCRENEVVSISTATSGHIDLHACSGLDFIRELAVE